MKIAVVATSVLGLLLGTTVPANAQHGNDHDQHGNSEKHQGTTIRKTTDARRTSSIRTNTERVTTSNGANSTPASSRGKATTGRNGSHITSRRMRPSTCGRPTGTNTNNTSNSEMFGRITAPTIGSVNIMVGAIAEVTGATAF